MCVAVAVFAPCVLWWQVQHIGSRSQSLCHVLWSQVWHIGSQLWSLHAQHGAAVAINVPHVLQSWSSCCVCRGRRCGMWGHGLHAVCVVVAGVLCPVMVVGAVLAPHALWLLPLHCVWCCCRPFRAAWGVTGAFVALGVV